MGEGGGGLVCVCDMSDYGHQSHPHHECHQRGNQVGLSVCVCFTVMCVCVEGRVQRVAVFVGGRDEGGGEG